MVVRPWLLGLALVSLAAALIWLRSALRLLRAARRIETEANAREAGVLARSAFLKDIHTALLYLVVAAGLGVSAFGKSLVDKGAVWALVVIPVLIAWRYSRRFLAEGSLAEERSKLERRAEEVLSQEELAPVRWAARLAPPELPRTEGFEIGQVYEPGTGAMAGDFYDVYPASATRLAVVIGDVAGHGIEPSITAFQVKYLLRVFLRQYRDPAQAIEELNVVLSTSGQPEELVSLCSVVFDTMAGTVRFASAGHPPAWFWHDGEVRPLRSTGPLLTLDPSGTYYSRELSLEPGDLLVLYTDGLAEARSGVALFGEERIASIIRRDPGQETTTLCKVLLEAARDFASEPLTDDVAILAVRRI
jgi:serine phosphatase RsbU (regulator of sigma subunit)